MTSVLHIVQTPLDHLGGPAVYVKELSKRLVKKGVDVGIVAPLCKSNKETEELQKLGINLHVVNSGILPCPVMRAPWFFSVKAHRVIKSVLNNYDIVNVHVESTFLQVVLDVFKEKKLITTVHGFPIREDIEALRHGFNLYKLIHLLLVSPQHYIALAKLVEKSNLVITVSNELKRVIMEVFHGKNKHIVTIPNGVDTDFFKPVEPSIARLIIRDLILQRCDKDIYGKHIILYFGRIEPRKGPDILLKAVAMLRSKEWFLILAGPIEQPEYGKYLRDLTRKLGISDRVCITGALPRDVLPALYSSSYVYVLPSLFEGLPATLLEAMACGTPVIASRVGGIPEVILNGANGILVNPYSIKELAEAIDYLLEDQVYRESIARKALQTVQNYSWDNITSNYLQMVNEIL